MSDTAVKYRPSAPTMEQDLDSFAVDNLECAQRMRELVRYWIWEAPKDARTGYRNVGKAFAELEV